MTVRATARFMAALLIAALLVTASLSGCQTGPSGAPSVVTGPSVGDDSEQEVVEIVEVVELTLEDLMYGDKTFVECSEEAAEFKLTLYVTAQPAIKQRPFEIWFCRRATGDSSTFYRPGYFCAAGPRGGMSGRVALGSNDDQALNVDIDLLWSSPEGKGKMEQQAELPFDRAGTKRISADRRIEWLFEPVADC